MAEAEIDPEPEVRQPCNIPPNDRLKHLVASCKNAVKLDYTKPLSQYYHAGMTMAKMANAYYFERKTENAYALYLKFMTLFMEEMPKHPDFEKDPVKAKVNNPDKMEKLISKVDKLQQILMRQYREDYEKFLIEKENQNLKNLVDSARNEASSSRHEVNNVVPMVVHQEQMESSVNYEWLPVTQYIVLRRLGWIRSV
ncbi:STAM-binding protein-like [Zophobas morio]|uniref:STAM-binding protein-like n=1 Tax=Zophobas morio TaxID=2755281 RepID=UPI0030837986